MLHFELIIISIFVYLKQGNNDREEAHKRGGENKRPGEHDWSSKHMGLPTKVLNSFGKWNTSKDI